MKFDPLKDGKSYIELIDWMGNDLTVVNDARASHEGESLEFCEKDRNLLIHLLTAYPQHLSPLRGVVLKFRVKAPLAICFQWYKHAVASAHIDDQHQHNQRSFRYSQVIDPTEFYIPDTFRSQSTKNKQSSADPLEGDENFSAIRILAESCQKSFDAYEALLQAGVCREQARFALNPAIYTSWVWTTSLQSALNFLAQRDHSAAQNEIAAYAQCVDQAVAYVVPETHRIWRAVQDAITPAIIAAMADVKARLKEENQ